LSYSLQALAAAQIATQEFDVGETQGDPLYVTQKLPLGFFFFFGKILIFSVHGSDNLEDFLLCLRTMGSYFSTKTSMLDTWPKLASYFTLLDFMYEAT
jgi:hypothetical protein